MHPTNGNPRTETLMEETKTVVTEKLKLENDIKHSKHFQRFSTIKFWYREQTD